MKGSCRIMAVLENIVCSLTASIIFDTVKLIISKFGVKKKPDNHYKDIINKIEIPDEYIMLIETGINKRIINTPIIGDMVYSYTLYQVGLSPKANGNTNQLIKGEQDLAYEIAKRIHNLYVEDGALTTTSINQIKNYIVFIAQSVKTIIFNELEDSSKIEVFYINSYISFLYQETKKELDNLQKLLKKRTLYENNTPDYIQAKENYYSILKSRFSEAHIYLLDKFQFDRFYVSPYLQNNRDKFTSKNYYLKTIETLPIDQSMNLFLIILMAKRVLNNT